MALEVSEEEYLAHYGTPRRSGRYPWGSGESGGGDKTRGSRTFLDHVNEMKRQGMTEVQVATALGMKTQDVRALRAIAKNEVKQADIAMVLRLREKGMSQVAIGQKMGINESSVRALLKDSEKEELDVLTSVSSKLKSEVDQHGYIQIGDGIESRVGVSRSRLDQAIAMAKIEGYETHTVEIEQLGTNNKTKVKVLGPPGSTQRDAWLAREEIHLINGHFEDNGRSSLGVVPPLSIDPKRVGVLYGPDGGDKADGVIYVRPGVDDVSLGGANYAQVRVAVNGTHYLKGMAMYKDDLPDGVDLMFNTNKKDTGNSLDAMKPLVRDKEGNVDAENPFGSVIDRQILKKDADGNDYTTSAMNIVNEDGTWDTWSRNLSSQMLSKQNPSLIKSQLDLVHERKRTEFEDIMSLTNPVVKEKLLQTFSDAVDASAVHLKAAALPRQATKVILPINSLKDTEIYAPTFNNGERVALIRYPHGGIFEIPELTVNNRNPEGKNILGQARDAVGINSKVAERLSGADFDGDTVLVIPNSKGLVKSDKALEGLKDFDAKKMYGLGPRAEGEKFTGNTQRLMGDVSNLITDMTIRGASKDELARAVRHSMVVIDAEKHNLNYKQSYDDNGIRALKERYQGGPRRGAATLISRARGTEDVDDRKARSAQDGGRIDRETGKLVFVPTGKVRKETITDPQTGETTTIETPKKMKVERLANTDDANTLIDSDKATVQERIYAEHSNRLKALANQARKEMVAIKDTPYSPSAKLAYKPEVDKLVSDLRVAIANRPLERQAQITANAIVHARRSANPGMEAPEVKKLKGQALSEARIRVGAKKELIEITPRQWEAIQAGAITPNRLREILRNADIDQVKQLAMPRQATVMTPVKQNRASAMLSQGYTQAEVAEALGVPVSTINSSLSRE